MDYFKSKSALFISFKFIIQYFEIEWGEKMALPILTDYRYFFLIIIFQLFHNFTPRGK